MHSDFPCSGSNQVWYVSRLVSGKLEELCMKRRRKPFCKASIKRNSDDSRLLDLFCLIQWEGLSALCAFYSPLSWNCVDKSLLPICESRNGTTEVHLVTFKMWFIWTHPIHFKRTPWRGRSVAELWPGGTCCPWLTNTRPPLIDCLVFYLWCGSN